ncbi:MAG: nuclear transport factor 2 family protein [Oscillospiraceae bacterium]|nr:nuclear transport factor 2 family protein [Oscillospiraceae bacterium]
MTVQEWVEIEEIKSLRMKYSHYTDTLQKEKLMALFSEDFIMETEASFTQPAMNKEALSQYVDELFSRHKPHEMFHSVSTPLIELIDENNATGVWYLLDYDVHYEQMFRLLGTYNDHYRKENGQWKITKTTLRVMWPNKWYR